MKRWPLAWAALLAVVVFAYRWQLDLGFTDTDAWADVVAANQPFSYQLTMPLTDGVGGRNANFFRPVVNLHFWGMRAVLGTSAALWQAWDLSLHLVCVLGLGAVVRAAGGRQSVALAAGALFGLHPIAVEVVPAVARSIDVLMAVFVLLGTWALLTRRLAVAVVAALLAMGTKESALAVIPALPIGAAFLYGRRAAFRTGAPLVVGLLVFLVMRGWVLDGAGGYSDSVLNLYGLEWVLRTTALELLAPGFGHHFVDWSWGPQLALGILATTGVAAAAYSVRDQRGALVGLVWLVLPLLLFGVLGVYGRRHLYLPLLGWCTVFAFVLHHRYARWAALCAVGFIVPHTPLVHPDEDWGLNDDVTGSVLAIEDDIRALPEGANVWVVDRCIRLNNDPARVVWFQEGESQNNCIASYSLQAWVDEVHGGVNLSRLSATYPDGPLEQADVSVEDDVLVVRRGENRRFFYKAAREAGWEFSGEGDTFRLHMLEPDNDWILVLGGAEASLVAVP
ncbi:MAG: hypothetical protein GY913_13675 [Proteobacteria bacterium]|nr:hypothetical protein [Pseudomonadota bacterium]